MDVVGDEAPGGSVEEVDVGDGAEEVGGVVVLLVEPAEEKAIFGGEVVIDAGGVDVVFAIDDLGVEEVVGLFGVLAGLVGERVEAAILAPTGSTLLWGMMLPGSGWREKRPLAAVEPGGGSGGRVRFGRGCFWGRGGSGW